ncbi:hypothetical protein HF876_03725 [Psychrobacillus sp. BL-248-WT-3]|nr:hypothetical protein [Psychrobacillus sp. BL-248-WT-3]
MKKSGGVIYHSDFLSDYIYYSPQSTTPLCYFVNKLNTLDLLGALDYGKSPSELTVPFEL